MGYKFTEHNVEYDVKTLQEFQGKSSGQNYYEIKQSIKPGHPWRDPAFPETRASFGESAFNPNFFWLRAKDICPNPVFYVDQEKCGDDEGCSRLDIMQGALSDCWFMVGMSTLAESPALRKVVIPEDNTFENDNSIFHFRFWRWGEWVDVVVDDRFPCYKTYDAKKNIVTTIAFAKNRGNEFWVPLMEKAYAKFNGSYSMLNLGMPGDALEDLTSGISTDIMLRSPTSKSFAWITNTLFEKYERGSVMTLGILSRRGDQPGETKQPNGLARGHAYSITGMGQVTYKGERVTLIRVRNPWGNEFEWNGAWSDDSAEWKSFDQNKIAKLNLKKGDGEYWMSVEDVLAEFDMLSICTLTGKILKEIAATGSDPKYYESHYFHGIWPGASCANAVEVAKNPQYLLDLTMNKEKRKDIETIIAVMHKGIRLCTKDSLPESYFAALYKINQTDGEIVSKFGSEAFMPSSPILSLAASPEQCTSRESYDEMKLAKTRYLIVPIFGVKVGYEGGFLLRVYTQGKSEMTELK